MASLSEDLGEQFAKQEVLKDELSDLGAPSPRFYLVDFADVSEYNKVFGQNRVVDLLPRKMLDDKSFVMPSISRRTDPYFERSVITSVDDTAKFRIVEIARGVSVDESGNPFTYPMILENSTKFDDPLACARAFIPHRKPEILDGLDLSGMTLQSTLPVSFDPMEWLDSFVDSMRNWGWDIVSDGTYALMRDSILEDIYLQSRD